MTLAELIEKLQALTEVPDSATVYIKIVEDYDDDSLAEAEHITVNNHGESITIW